MRDIVTNQAVAQLASSLGSTALSFTVVAGTSTSFPTAQFLVQIEDEVLLISTRQGDSFNIIARGQEGSLAVSHGPGSYVVNCLTAGMVAHLWERVPDGYQGSVPPAQRSQTGTSFDEEFEVDSGGWNFGPSTGFVTTTTGTPYRSWWHLKSTEWNGNYTLWRSAHITPPWRITARLSAGQHLNNPAGVNSWFCCLFASNLAPPHPYPENIGSHFQIGFYYGMLNSPTLGYRQVIQNGEQTLDWPREFVRVESFADNNQNHQSAYLPRSAQHQVVSIAYDGVNVSYYAGRDDALHLVYRQPFANFNIASLGIYSNVNCLTNETFHAYVDWIRVQS